MAHNACTYHQTGTAAPKVAFLAAADMLHLLQAAGRTAYLRNLRCSAARYHDKRYDLAAWESHFQFFLVFL